MQYMTKLHKLECIITMCSVQLSNISALFVLNQVIHLYRVDTIDNILNLNR